MNELILATTAAIITGAAIYGIYRFILLDRQDQKAKVTEWLLWAVTLAEKQYGGGMGKIKLREVYAMFVEAWPKVAEWMDFSTFAQLVDDALAQMKSMLRTNQAAYNFINDNKEVEE